MRDHPTWVGNCLPQSLLIWGRTLLKPLSQMSGGRNPSESDPELAAALARIHDSSVREAIAGLIRRAEYLAQTVEGLSRELREVDRYHTRAMERLHRHYGGEIAGLLGALEDLDESRSDRSAR